MYRNVRLVSRSALWNQQRSVAQINVKSVEDKPAAGHSEEWTNAKPVTEIPGPTTFQLIRGFFPGGVYYKKHMIEIISLTRQIYGDFYAIPVVFGRKRILLSFNPDDFPKILRSEGQWPRRHYLGTLNYHRKVHRKGDFGEVVGLLASNEEAWGKLRTAVNPVLMQPKNTRLYLNKMLDVSNEFLERIREIRDPKTLEMPASFEDEINRLAFESVAVIALNRQIGLIRKDRNNEEASRLFKSLRSIFEFAFQLDFRPSLWRIVKTSKFKEMMKSCDTKYDIIMKYINQALERIEHEKSTANENEDKSVLEKLLKIDKRVAVVMAMDMLMAGVDTTTSALVGILLCIAKNPEKQEKLRQEIRAILPQKDSQLTLDNMTNLPYLRACIKEGMRIYPVSPGILRSTDADIVLSGYQVPKNHDVLVCANLLSQDGKHHPKPEQYIPERWLRDANTANHQMNPFLHIPFGFGARSCVGRRIVELELEITVAKLVRNFYMEFNYPTEKAFKNTLINVPAIPLHFKFIEVEK